jgi:hypothetical protein
LAQVTSRRHAGSCGSSPPQVRHNVILLAVILLSWNSVAPIFKLDPYRGEFAFFCLLVLFHFQARILELSLSANMLHRFSVGSMAVLSITKLVAYSGIAWFGKLTLPTAILADTIAFALAYGLMAFAYRRFCPPAPGPRFGPPPTERKRLLRYGLFNNFNDAGTMVPEPQERQLFHRCVSRPGGGRRLCVL